MTEGNQKFIDIRKVISDKNPKLLKTLPNFIISYLERVLHEDEINEFIESNKNTNGFEFSENVLKKFNVRLRGHGIENVAKEGGVILACNHPLGGMDAMALIQVIKSHRTDIKFVVNDILLALDNLADLFVGVNKHGKNSAEALQEMNNVFSSGGATFVFPAGLVSRKTGGKVEDLEWKKTFVTRSKKFDVPVVPVFVDGELSKFFYRLSNLRSKFGLKANIEMLYLADEQFQQKDKVIDIYFGKPIPSSTFDKTKTDKEWAEWVKKIVYNLK